MIHTTSRKAVVSRVLNTLGYFVAATCGQHASRSIQREWKKREFLATGPAPAGVCTGTDCGTALLS